jgi:ABC-type sugar transport system permease subunit
MSKAINPNNTKNMLFILPALLIFTIFFIYPFMYTIVLSLYRGDGISTMSFVGLNNFREILYTDNAWRQSMKNAGFITLWALTFQNILALTLALAVERATRTAKIYRTIFFILPVISEIIIGLLMRELLKADPGVFNSFLNNIGLGAYTFDWLGDGPGSLVLLTTALVHCWRGFGWAFVIILAGLQTIPEQLYEAARIDGANSWQRFTKITLPLLLPVLSLVMILTLLGTMQSFTMILALTRGSAGLTEVPVMRIYDHLRGNQVGFACAEGVILGVILVLISFSAIFVTKKIKERYGTL